MEADEPRPPDIVDDAVGRLSEALAILDAIELGGMLAELPAEPLARKAHQRAVALLAVLRRDLATLREEVEAAGHAQDAIARALWRHAVETRRRAQP